MRFISPVWPLVGLTVAACSAVSPAGLITANRLDPLTTPPSSINVALGVPDTVQLTDGDATFTLSFVPEDTRIAAVSESVPLQLRSDELTAPAPNAASEAVYVAGFSDADAEKVAAAQARITSLKSGGVIGRGSLSISVDGGCTTSSLDSLPVSTWLQANPETKFVPLTRRQDVFKTMSDGQIEALKSKLEACG